METLYDILEVSPKASKEVIEKAYRTLVKRYHPDLQAPENKASAEEKMKQITAKSRQFRKPFLKVKLRLLFLIAFISNLFINPFYHVAIKKTIYVMAFLVMR